MRMVKLLLNRISTGIHSCRERSLEDIQVFLVLGLRRGLSLLLNLRCLLTGETLRKPRPSQAAVPVLGADSGSNGN
jgi:hypothetical protein